MGDDFYELEAKDGIRCTWKNWPNSKTIATRNVIPIVVLYTPRKSIERLTLVEYEPVFCSKCRCALNPFTSVDYASKAWLCSICLNRNIFPQVYKNYISEINLPSELTPQCSTMEYILPHQISSPPILMLVVDTCCSNSELEALKLSLLQVLNVLPSDVLVGLISIGKNALVYNLGWMEGMRCFSFKGDKKYTTQEVKDKLGILNARGPIPDEKRVVVPLGDCEFAVTSAIQELKRDPWHVAAGTRALRCTGTALSLAINTLEILHPNQGSRILVFSGGACNIGPGMIVSPDLEEPIRTYFDIKNDTAKHVKTAKQFYDELASQAGNNGHVIDIFSCSIDQIGLMEMRALSEKTGGYIIFSDSFETDVFKKSLQNMFNREETGALKMGFNANIQVFCSSDLKLSAVLGPGGSLPKKPAENNADPNKKTHLASIDFNTTLAYYWDLAGNELERGRKHEVIQFQTYYQHSSGRLRMRVTTVKFPVADPHNMSHFISGFDQETSAVAVARWAVHKSEVEPTKEVIAWIDRTLVRLIKVFAVYQDNALHTFQLCKEFSLFPQFMFYLRRSQLLQTFNVSPDESAYYQTVLQRENVINSLLMIQPALLSYSFESPQAQPVLLDIASLKNNVILLMDTFFTVLIWHGETIASWKKQGYQEREEYENFKTLLELPVEDALSIVQDRFPVPRFIETEHGKGHERVLKAKVNPSGGVESGNYFSEAVSLKVFTDSLIQYVIKP